ncbi:immunoglobulin domain-containing protein [Actomonas aquatica]|uniref:Immunoglobulin domain-containing protein n=1 Tax=Actomonas aquatica TaxID=2866162 RepID=A0ABZ1CF33_9BACT|nr:immunoglobulin domain-containing protein [Opitutus sp. WL0086]WRQ90017.1 immunoglobulin domain-containing protein [Opitutus sp. WL0086]
MTQPSAVVADEGSQAEFTAEASGFPAPTYQWRKDGAPISGATSSTLTIPSVIPSDAGSYTVVATNSQGSVTSSGATLTINAAPSISTQPQGGSVNEGAGYTLSVVATGATPLTYQWRKDGADIAGATNASLEFTGITPSDAGTYTVVVTNSVSSVTSADAVITVVEAPDITSNPGSLTVTAGETAEATFTVTYTGTDPVEFRWMKDGVDIPGGIATDVSYTVSPVSPTDAGNYSVRITNSAGSDTSEVAVLTVNYAPIITTQPTNKTSGVGGTVSFEVVANAVPAISGYQWFRIPAGGSTPEPMSGATDATLSLVGVQSTDNGNSYFVRITNTTGTTDSTTVTLTVNEQAAFTAHPVDVTVTEGLDASFTATVTGNPAPTLQWQYSPDQTTPMADIPGATDISLDLTGVTRAQAGYYQLVATNEFGTAESDEAFLDVQYAPEITTDLADPVGGVGEAVTLTIEGVANPEPTYQWYLIPPGGSTPQPIDGATAIEYVVEGLTLDDNGAKFFVVANNGIGDDVQSRTATLTVNEKAVVTSDPIGDIFEEGDSTTLSISFTGNPTPTFQWFKDGVAISGATDSSLEFTSLSRTDSGSYTVVATNSFGSDTSAAAIIDVQFAVEITQDITDVIAAVGADVTLAVDGVGNPEPTAQWYRILPEGSTGEPISGATSRELVLENVQLSDSGTMYYVIASNGVGEPVQSATVTLTVQLPASITLQPEGATLDQGQSHTMTIEVEGDPVPTIQWRRNGSAIAGATDVSYTIESASAASAGTYTAAVTNPQGTVISSGAVVVVNTPPVITGQPAGGTKVVGGSHTFRVTATGAQPLTYQWRKGGANISGATGATLTLSPLTLDNAGDYSVVVSNRLGSATSSTATLTVNRQLKAPTITTQPRDTSVRAGSAASFTVVAEGNPLPTYQWRKNGVAISGATSATLTIAAAADADAGRYDVVITNSQGSISSSLVKLTVTSADTAPVITSQPRDKTIGQGTATTFTVAATGVPAPTYQWRKNGAAIAGATSASYTIASPVVADSGAYSVVVTNSAGSVTSRNAQLRVLEKVYGGTYFGSFGEGRGSFAIVIKDDNTGTFLGFDEIAELYVSGTVTVAADGSFSLTVTSETAAGSSSDRSVGADQSGPIAVIGKGATAREDVTFSGTISESGSLTGTVTGVPGLSMDATREVENENDPRDQVAGFYEASSGGSDAVTLTIIAPSGKVLLLTKTAAGADAGVGTATEDGAISVTTVKNNTVTATVSATSATIEAAVTDSEGNTTEFVGGNDDVLATQRLTNISTRAYVGTGIEQTVAGLVITGEDSKPVLIRAVGPGLGAFNVSGAIAAPKLDLLEGQTVIATNTGWSSSADADEIAAVANLAGAFALDTANADSAILETLAPGVYTAQASGADGGTGVVLIEIYDLSSPVAGQKLFNISTRAVVGAGDRTAVAGFVVSGSVPKRVLLRGIGPALAGFNVPGALTDSYITLLKGEEVVATNDDWGTNAAAVAEASSTAGAFELAAGSKDAAMVISLEPGVYTLQLTGVDGATGIGLIEVYEVP